MGIGVKFEVPFLGTVKSQYVPKADGTKNADNEASENTGMKGSGTEIVVVTPLGGLPVVGDVLDGFTITAGYAEEEMATVANTSDRQEYTAALTGSIGNFKFGYQREAIDEGQTVALTDADFYKVETIGLAYAVNDALSISYNTIEQEQHNIDADSSFTQDTDAINIGYTVGGMTIGFQDASTDNANMVKNAKDDTRTIGISVAF
jgi:hypothetical protein